jgi:hypothetical protein
LCVGGCTVGGGGRGTFVFIDDLRVYTTSLFLASFSSSYTVQ